MDRKAPTVGEEWRDVRGWVPWLVAGIYFPLYVTLDYVAGEFVATRLGLPQSVGVALFSLSVTLLVTSVVTVTKLDSGSLSRAVDAANPFTHSRGRGKSTVGSSGAVNRRTVGSFSRGTSTDSTDESPAVQEAANASGADGAEGDGAEEDDDWPGEWIPGDQL